MKCPHCQVEVNPSFQTHILGNDQNGIWSALYMNCPNDSCKKLIVKMQSFFKNARQIQPLINEYIVWPMFQNIQKAPPEVDADIAQDFNEASLILNMSPKASAALSRRCLQNIIRSKAGITKKNLVDEIQELLDKGNLPTPIAESIDYIRNIGNFSAHPMKSQTTGQIIEVEKGEAEWSIEVLLMLFDYYYVQPSKITERRKSLDAKLKEAGKPPSK